MNETKEIIFKPAFFSRKQKLILNAEFIEFFKSPDDKTPIRFSKLEIDGMRFGIRWIRGYQFYIGRIYCVDIKNTAGAIIKFRLKSIYKINTNQLRKKYSIVLNTIFRYYFNEAIVQYLKMFTYKQPFFILNVQFKQDGILINEKNDFISWADIETRSYTTYYTISSKSKPGFYKAFDYIEDWNVWVLYSVLSNILKVKI